MLEDSKRLAEMVRLGRSGQAIKIANQVAPTVLEASVAEHFTAWCPRIV